MKLSTFGAVSAAFAVSAAACAQTPKPYQQIGVALRAGVYLPTNETTVGDVGSGIFAFGGDYRLSVKTPSLSGLQSHLGISVDYFRRNEIGNIPVLLNYVATTGQYSFQAGAGVGFSSLRSGDRTTFAYDLGVGYDLPVNSTLPVFVQATFFGSDFAQTNGFGLYVGVRF